MNLPLESTLFWLENINKLWHKMRRNIMLRINVHFPPTNMVYLTGMFPTKKVDSGFLLLGQNTIYLGGFLFNTSNQYPSGSAKITQMKLLLRGLHTSMHLRYLLQTQVLSYVLHLAVSGMQHLPFQVARSKHKRHCRRSRDDQILDAVRRFHCLLETNRHSQSHGCCHGQIR